MMVFKYFIKKILYLAAFIIIPAAPASASQTPCYKTPTPACFLEQILVTIQSHPSIDEKENLLIGLGFESSFLNKKDVFRKTMIELEKINEPLHNSFSKALKKLSSTIKTNHSTMNLSNNLFSNAIAKQLAQEEIFLNIIKDNSLNLNKLVDDSNNKNNANFFDSNFFDNTPFNDSLHWTASQIYYLTLTREVSLKKSTELKRRLIKHLAKSPPQQHQQRNLEISLIETLGGALKQGQETRLISNINGFSPHHLVRLNQRILFYQEFTELYNTKVGLHQDRCDTPMITLSNSLNTLFSQENAQFIKHLETFTVTDPNDYLLSSTIIRHLDKCTPLSTFFEQRYLQSLATIPLTTPLTIAPEVTTKKESSLTNVIRHLRSLRRYTKL